MVLAAAAVIAAVVITGVMLSGDPPPRDRTGPGVVLVYEVAPFEGQTQTQARDLAIAGIRARLDEKGTDRPSVRAVGPAQVEIQFGGDPDSVDHVIELIERRAALGIHHVVELDPEMKATIDAAKAEAPSGITAEVDVWDGPDGPHRDEYLWSEDRLRLEAWLQGKGPAVGAGDRRVVLESMAPAAAPIKSRWRTYVIERAPIIGGADVARASVTYDQNTMRPEVELVLDDDGRVRFGQATAAAIGRKLAIVLDGRVMSAPVVMSEIPGGSIRVTMGYSDDPGDAERQAHALVSVVRAGTMPALRLVDRIDVGPAR